MVEEDMLDETFAVISAMKQPFQAFALVGYYLTVFSAMEASLDGFIGNLLGLTWPQERIVMANLGFAEKIHTARALLNETSSEAVFKRDGDALLSALLNVHAAQRNEIAHGFAFGNNNEGGALLSTFRARSKAREGVVMLTIEEAKRRVMSLLDAAHKLTAMGKETSIEAAKLNEIAVQELAKLRM